MDRGSIAVIRTNNHNKDIYINKMMVHDQVNFKRKGTVLGLFFLQNSVKIRIHTCLIICANDTEITYQVNE